jgi:hypothetical protein
VDAVAEVLEAELRPDPVQSLDGLLACCPGGFLFAGVPDRGGVADGCAAPGCQPPQCSPGQESAQAEAPPSGFEAGGAERTFRGLMPLSAPGLG